MSLEQELTELNQQLQLISVANVNSENYKEIAKKLSRFREIIFATATLKISDDKSQEAKVFFQEKASLLLPHIFQAFLNHKKKLPNWTVNYLLQSIISNNPEAGSKILTACLSGVNLPEYQNFSQNALMALASTFRNCSFDYTPFLIDHAFYLQQAFFPLEARQQYGFHNAVAIDYYNRIDTLKLEASKIPNFFRETSALKKDIKEKIIQNFQDGDYLAAIRNNIYNSLEKTLYKKINQLLPELLRGSNYGNIETILQLWLDVLKNQCSDTNTFNEMIQILTPQFIKNCGMKCHPLFAAIFSSFSNGYYITPESLAKQREFLIVTNNDNSKAFLELCPQTNSKMAEMAVDLNLLDRMLSIFQVYGTPTEQGGFYGLMIKQFLKKIIRAELIDLQFLKPYLMKMLNIGSQDERMNVLIYLLTQVTSVEKKDFFLEIILSQLSQLTEAQKQIVNKFYHAEDESEEKKLVLLLLSFYSEKRRIHDMQYFVQGDSVNTKPWPQDTFIRNEKDKIQAIIKLANKINSKAVDFLILSFSEHGYYSLDNIITDEKISRKHNVAFFNRIKSYFKNENQIPTDDELNKIMTYYAGYFKAKLFYEIGQLFAGRNLHFGYQDDFSYFFHTNGLFKITLYEEGGWAGEKVTYLGELLPTKYINLVKSIQAAKNFQELIKIVDDFSAGWSNWGFFRSDKDEEIIKKLLNVKEEIINTIEDVEKIKSLQQKINKHFSSGSFKQGLQREESKPAPADDLDLLLDESPLSSAQTSGETPQLTACQKKMDEFDNKVTANKSSEINIQVSLSALAENAVVHQPSAPSQVVIEKKKEDEDYDSIKLKDKNNPRVKLWLELSGKITELAELSGKTYEALINDFFPLDIDDAILNIILDPFYRFHMASCPIILDPVLGKNGLTYDANNLQLYFQLADVKNRYPQTNQEFTKPEKVTPNVDARGLIEKELKEKIQAVKKQICEFENIETLNNYALIDFGHFTKVNATLPTVSKDEILQPEVIHTKTAAELKEEAEQKEADQLASLLNSFSIMKEVSSSQNTANKNQQEKTEALAKANDVEKKKKKAALKA